MVTCPGEEDVEDHVEKTNRRSLLGLYGRMKILCSVDLACSLTFLKGPHALMVKGQRSLFVRSHSHEDACGCGDGLNYSRMVETCRGEGEGNFYMYILISVSFSLLNFNLL